MWNTLREIPKFTPKAEVDRIFGASPVRIEDRPAWYYGGGFVLHYRSEEHTSELQSPWN